MWNWRWDWDWNASSVSDAVAVVVPDGGDDSCANDDDGDDCDVEPMMSKSRLEDVDDGDDVVDAGTPRPKSAPEEEPKTRAGLRAPKS